MEMEVGGESLEKIMALKHFTEDESAQLMQGIFQALSYLHEECNVIHRDLKPENVLISDPSNLRSVKLCDFGLSVECTKSSMQDFARCGTLLYTPPE